ncbi:MAG: AraC family transcriptional regulator [Clostridia bacterium]|nr:AraC family transcriptional regulator [Clostridia bacterium]MBQ8430210.1 AraC family transcriptional regulator [Clostridia bacterium]
MKREVMIGNTNAHDLVPIFVGHELCQKKHKFGPHTRDYYIIHFCLKGAGKLFDQYGCHKIGAGELFIIRPEEITTYVADSENPWEYAWIAFHGDMANIFNAGKSVYAVPLDFGGDIRDLTQNDVSSPAIYISLLFRLIHLLFNRQEETSTSDVVEKIKQYVRFNYMNEITVAYLSEYFGFERSYLYRLFQRSCGIGIKEFIIKTRMEQAKSLLDKGYGVGETAFAVGYKDQFNFSKAYKRHFSVPPKAQKR